MKTITIHYKESDHRGLRCGSKEYKHWTHDEKQVTCEACKKCLAIDKKFIKALAKIFGNRVKL